MRSRKADNRDFSSLSRIAQNTEPMEPTALAQAIAAIRNAELVVYPTETFYGLAADPYSDIAIDRLFAVKGREAAKAVALIAADTASAFAIAREVPDAGARTRRKILAGTVDAGAAGARRFRTVPARHRRWNWRARFAASDRLRAGGRIGTSDYSNQRQSVRRAPRDYRGANEERARPASQSLSRGWNIGRRCA